MKQIGKSPHDAHRVAFTITAEHVPHPHPHHNQPTFISNKPTHHLLPHSPHHPSHPPHTTLHHATPHHTTLPITATDQTPNPYHGTLYPAPITRGAPIRQRAADWSIPPKPLPSIRILALQTSSSGAKTATFYKTYTTLPSTIPHPRSTLPTTRSYTLMPSARYTH